MYFLLSSRARLTVLAIYLAQLVTLSSQHIIAEKLLFREKKLPGSGIKVRGVEFKVWGVSKHIKYLESCSGCQRETTGGGGVGLH